MGEQVFELTTDGAPHGELTVVSFRGQEEISKPYSFEILVTGRGLDAATIERDLLGQPASLTMADEGDAGRVVHGVLRRVEAEGTSGGGEDRHRYRLWLAPRLWLLGQGQNSRIFQDKTVREIVAQVLEGGNVSHRWNLLGSYTPRLYCVQHQESDLAFVRRLLAEEGIFFSFDHPEGRREREVVVFGDSAMVCGPIAGSPALRFQDSAGMIEPEQDIRRFRVSRRVRPSSTLLKNFDFRHPSLQLVSSAEGGAIGSTFGESVGTAVSAALGAVGAALPGSPSLPFDPAAAARAAGLPGDLNFPSAPSPEAVASHLGERARSTLREAGSQALQAGSSALRDAGSALREGGSSALRDAGSSLLQAGASALQGAASLLQNVVSPLANAPTLLRVYDHHGEFEGVDILPKIAALHLDQRRHDSVVASGRSRCKRLLPGKRFELTGGLLAEREDGYTVIRIEHEGHHPEAIRVDAGGANSQEVYKNRFYCVPAAIAPRPRRPRRRIQQTLETATVVGAPGQEIHTDELGRIRVQFHWDLQGRRNDHSSCWIRTMQSWAGTGWGFQFIPRVGMEVLVMFVGGDMDRPMVVGSAYNAENPVPFLLPAQKTKSGIRTRSTRGGDGHNELSFEDRKGHEKVYTHAQKDLEAVVRHDQMTRVGGSQTEHVQGNQFSIVAGNRVRSTDGNATALVSGNDSRSVEGDQSRTVQGNTLEVVSGRADQRVAGDLSLRVEGNERREIGATSKWVVHEDLTLEIAGSATTVVGKSDAKRSYVVHVEGTSELSSTGGSEIVSDKGITLRCGKTLLHLGPEGLEIDSPSIVLRGGGGRIAIGDDNVKLFAKTRVLATSDDKIILKSSGAGLGLDADARLDGASVKLKSPVSASDSASSETAQLTTIELCDDEGNPVPHQRYRIVLGDGSELEGFLDGEGKAVIELEEGGTIVFPDFSGAEEA